MNEGQHRIEAAAIQLYRHPLVDDARRHVADFFRQDPHARDPRMLQRLQPAADAIVFSAALVAANEDPSRPEISLFECAAHRWMGLVVPDARWGVDNPDNIYRFAPLDGASTYRLEGHFAADLPADFGLSVLDRFFGDGGHSRTLGFLGIDGLVMDDQRRFVVTLGPEPADGRANHIQLLPEASFLIIRDSLADWLLERPAQLRLTRLSGPKPVQRSEEDLARRAAALAVATATTFMPLIQHGLYERAPANELPPLISAGANGGLVTQSSLLGHYQLADDEALVISARRGGARYMGFQLADLWMRSYDYDRRLSSMNHHEAGPDADGWIRLVLCPRDPGVRHWVDDGGVGRGSFTLRWQGVPPGAGDEGPQAHGQVVRLADLRHVLPADTRWLDAEGRRAQQERRVKGYAWRFIA